ncbi:MAG: hypothetical protein IJU37_11675 [Desulfovibrio sp.]|nr:hypothetical protein [Desulfovibrio sp.]
MFLQEIVGQRSFLQRDVKNSFSPVSSFLQEGNDILSFCLRQPFHQGFASLDAAALSVYFLENDWQILFINGFKGGSDAKKTWY